MQMHRKLLSFLIFILITHFSIAQKDKFSGTVYEKGTKNPLAFASVVIKESKLGIITDIDGKFSFAKVPETFTLKISNVGFKTKEIEIKETSKPLLIELEPENNNLETVIISNGENPAHRIIKLLISNKKKNNPKQLSSFKYNSYTISSVGFGDGFASNRNSSTTKKQQKPISAKEQKRDSIVLKFAKKIKANHLMVTESYIERKFRFPNRSIETVLATKVSGLKEAQFALTASSFQPFGFYKDYLEMGVDKYVSPIINGSIAFYNFRLKETIVNDSDTTFVISFEPRKNKNFNGLKGLLYINSDGYAIENVIASQATEKGIAFRFKLQQQYKKIEGKWFPQQLNTTVNQVSLDSAAVLINWDSRSYITNVSIGEKFPLSAFSDVAQVYDKAAGKKTDAAWEQLRTDSLTTKEKETYKIYDSLPVKTLNKINRINKLINLVTLNAIPWGKIDIPFKYSSNVNNYEGFRLGVGMQTNPSLSKYFSLGAFAGYGFKDKAWKYGGNVFFPIKERTATTLTFSYEKNLAEPGTIDYFTKNNNVLFAQTTRKILTARMDSVEQFKIDFTTKITPSLQANIWLQNEKRNPAKYDYLFENLQTGTDTRNFTNTEIAMGFRYVRGESFTRIGRAKIQNKLPTTQVLLQVSKGLKDVWKGDFDYTKTAIEINHTFNSKWLGQTFVQLDAGKIWGNIPYSYLFNTKASSPERSTSIYIPNTFQTVGLYEFAASQSVSLFLQQDFGSLLFKPKSILFRPTFLLVQGISFGKLNNPSGHKNLVFQTANKGLFESGIMVKNLYRKNVNNLFYLGLGGGVFYRYGYYQLPKSSDNLAFKLGLNFSF
jgi:Family of unknown function (DUF5686)/CarboxypepD_reg-like domain